MTQQVCQYLLRYPQHSLHALPPYPSNEQARRHHPAGVAPDHLPRTRYSPSTSTCPASSHLDKQAYQHLSPPPAPCMLSFPQSPTFPMSGLAATTAQVAAAQLQDCITSSPQTALSSSAYC